jgi:PAS domain S-box-containing protein
MVWHFDFTERKKTEEALRESEERLRQTTQLARIGYYVWDAVEDRCLYCSDEHARIHGLSPDEFIALASPMVGEDCLTHPDDQDAFWSAMRDLRSGKTIEIEYRTVTSNGKIYHVREIAEPVFDEAGRVVQEIGASQDVTALRLAEERSRQAQKMEAVGQLTGGIAHDFNNLLAVILGNAEIVGEQLGGDHKSAQAIVRAANRGAELTQRLLAFSRRQPLHSEEIDLEQLTHGMGHLLRRSLGETIEIQISSAPALWSALADHGQVENALLNLAINARDAMPDDGKLTISAANATLEEIHLASQTELSPGDYVVLTVSDTGAGMTPEVLAHVFEPFYTTKEVGEGSGLGLSMVYGFAKQSGGGLVIRSEPGHGTTVEIYLPRGAEISNRIDPHKVAVAPLGHGETVLVVEDDPDVRALTETMLTSLGYLVLTANDAWVGIEALRAEVPVDLILSDVVLPGGMSGPDLAEQAKFINPGIKILFMSGYAEKGFQHRNPLPKDADLLNKPFRKSELAKRVRQALIHHSTDFPGRDSQLLRG